MTFIVSTDSAINTAGLEFRISSLEEYKEYLRKEYAYSSCCLAVIEDLKTIKKFRDVPGYHVFSGTSCIECNRGNAWWQATYIKEVKDERTSKECIIASLGENASDYDETDIEQMAAYRDQLVKCENKEFFLALISQVLWDSSIKPEHIDLIMQVEGSS
ncbi:MAG: hypothetical protein ACTSYA_01760 [Candidatus Kariarchaeaceae archaeon]